MENRRASLAEREDFIAAVEQSYFANLDAKNLEAVLECFQPDATFTIQSAFHRYEGREAEIRGMLERLFERYEKTIHKDFSHVIDLQAGGCASQFNVENVGWDGSVEYLSNCNFFRFEGTKFKEVSVYMSGGVNTLG